MTDEQLLQEELKDKAHNENELPHVDPSDWPQTKEEETTLTDQEALTVALLILDGKPRSYVEGAKRLAQYVLDLNLQIEQRSIAIAEMMKRDTIPVVTEIPEGAFTEEQKEQVSRSMFDMDK